MKHTKKLLAIAAALVMVFSLAVVLMIGTGAENATPSLTVNYANLSFGNNISVVYAVSAKNTDSVELLIWDEPQANYEKGTQSYTVSSTGVQNINGEPHHIFFMNHLGANQMTDTLYAVAHSVVDEIDYYSPVVRYSIIEYAYDILGMDGTPSTNENLKTLVKEMLEYGAAAQVLTNYKTDSLATGDFVLVKTTNGTLADGFKSTVVAEGTTVNISAPATVDGKTFHSWVDSNNNHVSYDKDATIQASANTYSALYYNTTGKGDFIYELDATLPYDVSESAGPMKVDGVLDDMYKNGIYLQSYYYRDANGTAYPDGNPDGTTFEVYMTADAKNVYVYYHFDKKTEIGFKNDYTSLWHEDNVDFCFNANAGDAIGKEFHILGGVEGGHGEATVNSRPDYLTDYYVKHDATGYGYSVEFAIPLSQVSGTDGEGNKMFSFTALGTLVYDWPENQTAPSRTYTTAYKAVWDKSTDGKAAPSYVIIKETAQDDATTPTRKDDNGNYVYEITKNVAEEITVDGLRDGSYNTHGVHQKSVANFSPNKTTFDVYYTADEEHIYVLYEFTKREPIYYISDYGSKYHEDCADFVLDLGGAGVTTNEFRILAGVEGGMGTAVHDRGTDAALAACGVDNYYVKHTHNGYNIEFSIPLSKVTGVEGNGSNGNKVISFTACSTVTTGWSSETELGRVYTTANSASGKAGNDAKATPNYLVVKNAQLEYTLTETKDTINYTDGLKDSAYDSGIHMVPKYFEYYSDTNVNATNTYDFYMTADASNVYMLFIVKDDNIVKDGSEYWYNDCAEVMWDVNGVMNGYAAGSTDVRFFGNTAGTNHYGTAESTCTKGGGNITLGKGGLKSYTVIHTAEGYNVEFVIERSAFTNKNVFSFAAMGTLASSATSRTYVSSETGNGACNSNGAKKCLNKVTIVPAN